MCDMGRLSDVRALRSIFDPDGLRLMDIGCGDGTLARKLAYVGATVTGVEPDSIQAQKNAAAEPMENVRFVQARACEIPADDNSVDGLIFSLSLHHVPRDQMRASLEEARRVIAPGGFMAVAEPLLEGSHNAAIELFHDETEVRQHAIEALKKFARPLFTNWRQYFYTSEARYDNFEVFSNRYINTTYNSLDRDIITSDAVRKRFESNRDGDDYLLLQPMRIDYYRD